MKRERRKEKEEMIQSSPLAAANMAKMGSNMESRDREELKLEPEEEEIVRQDEAEVLWSNP